MHGLVDFSKKRFEKANKSPYDSTIKNSKFFQVTEVVYLYFVVLVLFLYGVLIALIGILGQAGILGSVLVVLFGVLILILARFVKVAADKAYYRFKHGADWNDET